MALGVVVGAELCGCLVETCCLQRILIYIFLIAHIAGGCWRSVRTGVGLEDAATALPLVADDPTHCGGGRRSEDVVVDVISNFGWQAVVKLQGG